MYVNQFSFSGKYPEGDVWHGGNHIHIELSVETFLDDLHVQQSKEPASEPETQCS